MPHPALPAQVSAALLFIVTPQAYFSTYSASGFQGQDFIPRPHIAPASGPPTGRAFLAVGVPHLVAVKHQLWPCRNRTGGAFAGASIAQVAKFLETEITRVRWANWLSRHRIIAWPIGRCLDQICGDRQLVQGDIRTDDCMRSRSVPVRRGSRGCHIHPVADRAGSRREIHERGHAPCWFGGDFNRGPEINNEYLGPRCQRFIWRVNSASVKRSSAGLRCDPCSNATSGS